MTLVVGQRQPNRIRIWSDSALQKNLDPRTGYFAMGLKAFVLHKGLCVAFAGPAEDATAAILNLDIDPQTSFAVDEVVARLCRTHKQMGHRIDFLIGSMSPTPTLIRISDGQAISVECASFIGLPSAYSAYQQRYDPTEGDDAMLGAMESLIDDETIPGVGGVPVGVDSKPFGFGYRPGWATLASSHATVISPAIVPGQEYPIPIAKTAAEGGYRNVFAVPAKPGVCAFAVYFEPGCLGLLLNPRVTLYPIRFTNVTQNEFAEQVSDRYGVELVFHGKLSSDR